MRRAVWCLAAVAGLFAVSSADAHEIGKTQISATFRDDRAYQIDVTVDPDALRALFASNAPRSQVVVLPHINHFAIFTDPMALQKITEWLRSLPPDSSRPQR